MDLLILDFGLPLYLEKGEKSPHDQISKHLDRACALHDWVSAFSQYQV